MSPHFKNKQDYTYLSFVEVRGNNLSLKLEVSVGYLLVWKACPLFSPSCCVLSRGPGRPPSLAKLTRGAEYLTPTSGELNFVWGSPLWEVLRGFLSGQLRRRCVHFHRRLCGKESVTVDKKKSSKRGNTRV